jgi:hypothetical protein
MGMLRNQNWRQERFVSGHHHKNQTGCTTIDLCQLTGPLSSETGSVSGACFALHKQGFSIRNNFAEKVIKISEL